MADSPPHQLRNPQEPHSPTHRHALNTGEYVEIEYAALPVFLAVFL
jgi:hypothetical protein